MKFTESDLRKMGHDPDELRDSTDGRPREVHEPVERTTPDRQPTQALTFAIDGRPPRKRQGKAGIKANQEGKRRVEAAAEAALYCRGDLNAWPVEGRCGLSVVAVYPDGNHADLSNIVKAVEDGLSGYLYDDDRQIKDWLEPMMVRESDHIGDGITVVRVEVLE